MNEPESSSESAEEFEDESLFLLFFFLLFSFFLFLLFSFFFFFRSEEVGRGDRSERFRSDLSRLKLKRFINTCEGLENVSKKTKQV
jgi:hypothetical protein